MLLLCREEFEAGRGKKKEVVIEEFDLMCHETLEDLEIPDAVHVDIAYDLESARCYP